MLVSSALPPCDPQGKERPHPCRTLSPSQEEAWEKKVLWPFNQPRLVMLLLVVWGWDRLHVWAGTLAPPMSLPRHLVPGTWDSQTPSFFLLLLRARYENGGHMAFMWKASKSTLLEEDQAMEKEGREWLSPEENLPHSLGVSFPPCLLLPR